MKNRILCLILTIIMVILPIVVRAEGDEPLAKIGDIQYSTLQEAVDAVEYNAATPTTIEILRDATDTPGIKVIASQPKNLIIDFKGHTIQLGKPLVGSTGTVSQNIHLEKGSTFIFKNGTLKADPTARMLFQNYANLTLQDLTIDSTTMTSDKVTYAVSSNNGVVNILGNTNIYSNNIALDVYWWPTNNGNVAYPDGTQVIVNTTGSIKGIIDMSYSSSPETSKTTLVIENVKHVGELNIADELKDNLTIKGGIYSTKLENPTLEEDIQYYEVLNSDGETKYTIAKESELKQEIM